MKKITIRRVKGCSAIPRKLMLVADGAVIGQLNEGEEKIFEIQEHTNEIWGQIGWSKTKKFRVKDFRPNSSIFFEEAFSFNPLNWFKIMKIHYKVYLVEFDDV